MSTTKRARYDLTSVLARLEQQDRRIAALEKIVASQLPPANADSTMCPKEAADELGVSLPRISQLIKSGKLRVLPSGNGRIRIDAGSVAALKRPLKV